MRSKRVATSRKSLARRRSSSLPTNDKIRIRFRVDGVLQPRQGPPKSMHSALVQRLKVMAHLDLTQTRRPQDGKFRLRHRGQNVDIRMSTLPTIYGENVVLRLLATREPRLAVAENRFHECSVLRPRHRVEEPRGLGQFRARPPRLAKLQHWRARAC